MKSGCKANLIFASSNSFSRLICSLNALTNSSSSSYFKGDCLLAASELYKLDEPNLEGLEYSFCEDLCNNSLVTSFLGLIGDEWVGLGCSSAVNLLGELDDL